MIRRLAAEGVPKARIAERLGISRTTVVKAVASDAPPRYERRPVETSFVVFEARVRALLADEPEMPATVLAERVGWTGSITWFRAEREAAAPGLPAGGSGGSAVWEPGDAAQCDLWFPPRRIPLEDGTARLLPVLVITAAHSRFMLARMIPTRKTEDLLLGSWELLQQLGRVPRRLIWDNESGIGRGQRRAEGVPAFIGTLATRLVLLPPRDPESKGIVERRNGFFETSFMPGRHVRVPGGLQRPVRRLAGRREHPGGAHHQGPTRSTCSRRTWPDAAAATGRRCTWAGATGSGWAGTTTCAWTPATTRWTRP